MFCIKGGNSYVTWEQIMVLLHYHNFNNITWLFNYFFSGIEARNLLQIGSSLIDDQVIFFGISNFTQDFKTFLFWSCLTSTASLASSTHIWEVIAISHPHSLTHSFSLSPSLCLDHPLWLLSFNPPFHIPILCFFSSSYCPPQHSDLLITLYFALLLPTLPSCS